MAEISHYYSWVLTQDPGPRLGKGKVLIVWEISWSDLGHYGKQPPRAEWYTLHLHNHSYARSQPGSITYGIVLINWSRIPSFGSPNPAWELFPIVSGHTYCVAKFRLHSTVRNITIQYSIVTLHRINCKFHEVRYHSFSIGGPGLWSMKLCDTFMILHESWLWSRVLGRGGVGAWVYILNKCSPCMNKIYKYLERKKKWSKSVKKFNTKREKGKRDTWLNYCSFWDQ